MHLTNTINNVEVIDLFCGAGGLTHGFALEGFKVIAGIDLDSNCKYPYEINNNSIFIEKDIKSISSKEINDLYNNEKIKILVGCAPCQPFSKYTQKQEKINLKATKQSNKQYDLLKDIDENKSFPDKNWPLLKEFQRLIYDTEPSIISMENVCELESYTIFKDFAISLESKKYFVTKYSIHCPSYGIPQNRNRLVLFASKYSPINIIHPTHSEENFVTVKNAISHLPPIEQGQADPNDPLHRSSKLSNKNLQRILQSKQGGTWRDWDNDLILNCHKKKEGQFYSAVYGRMDWNKPSPTITTQFFGYGNGRFGHPEQNRAISLREGAILQSFPEYYKFVNDKNKISISNIGKMIGNAVPVKLGQVVAKSIKIHLEQEGKL
jgi:DNA (cytosine-5)-methyltransferase 1